MPKVRTLLVVSRVVAIALSGLPGAEVEQAAASAMPAVWSIDVSPNPTGSTSAMLAGVSCSSSDRCTAVGDYDSAGGLFTLAERWNGSTWSIETTPNAPNVHSNVLESVSCAGPRFCTAVGYSVTAKAVIRALVEQWNGTTWALEPSPLPTGGHSVELYGVSCSAPDSCEAVGGYLKNEITGQYQPLAEVWNGSTWTVQLTPNPEAENGSSLSSVSCSTPDTCTAGGNYAYADVAQSIFAFRWNGTSWVEQHQPNPGGNDDNTDAAVSCPSPTACTTVGSRSNADDQIDPLAEHWDGRAWSRQSTPGPHGAGTTELNGVSCPGSVACTAVGDWSPASDQEIRSTLAELWNGTTWRIETTPEVPGGHISTLDAVACPSTTFCVAVGDSWNGSVTVTLAEASSV